MARKTYMELVEERGKKYLSDPDLFIKDIGFLLEPDPKSYIEDKDDEGNIIRRYAGKKFIQKWQREAIHEFNALILSKLNLAKKGKMSKKDRELSKKIGVSIMSAKGVGKTSLMALKCLYFLFCFKGSNIYLLGPKYDQLRNSLWKEIAYWVRFSSETLKENSGDSRQDTLFNCAFEKAGDRFFFNKWEGSIKKKATGIEWMIKIVNFNRNQSLEDQKAAIQGLHGEHMMIVVDEASGVPCHIFEPLETTLTAVAGGVNLLNIIFNPNKTHGYALDTHNKMKDSWITRHVNAYESENVSDDAIERMARNWGKESPKFRVSVLGLPPLTDDDAFIPYSWIKAAQDRWEDMDPLNHLDELEKEPYVFGIDIGGTNDPSVIYTRRGNVFLESFEFKSADTVATEEWILRLIYNHDPDKVYIDSNGIGEHIAARLKAKLGSRVVKPIKAHRKPRNENEFDTIKDELCWAMREAFQEGIISIPPKDEELEGELSVLKYDPDYNGRGLIKMVSKKVLRTDLRNRIGKDSHDRVDAIFPTFLDSYEKQLRIRDGRSDASGFSFNWNKGLEHMAGRTYMSY